MDHMRGYSRKHASAVLRSIQEEAIVIQIQNYTFYICAHLVSFRGPAHLHLHDFLLFDHTTEIYVRQHRVSKTLDRFASGHQEPAQRA